MDERFIRAASVLGADAMDTLRRSHVMIFGLGGVGSWCAEALCRSGIGALTLVDQDCVGLSNCNRQLCALESTVGHSKAEVLTERLRDINPACRITAIAERYEAVTRERFFTEPIDYIVDAIDLVSCKLDLIETAQTWQIPIVSALGTGNKLDAQRLRITDIAKTQGCPLARIVRKELRRRGIEHLAVVYSDEESAACEQNETPPPGRRSVPGSLVWVPATAGMLLCQQVVLTLCGLTEKERK